MTFFRYPWKNWFGSKKKETSKSEDNITIEPNDNEEFEENSTISFTKYPANRTKTAYTSQSSNALEGYLSNSYEQQGYDDSYAHPDIEYLNIGKKYLISNMKSLLIKAIESFTFDKAELQSVIKTHQKLGEMDTVGYLTARIIKFDLKLNRINAFLKDMESNTGESERVLLSYERGFRRGLAEITRAKFK